MTLTNDATVNPGQVPDGTATNEEASSARPRAGRREWVGLAMLVRRSPWSVAA